MDYLEELPTDAAKRKALSSLPPDLKSTYERILERVNHKNEAVQIIVQRALKWILGSHRHENISFSAIREAISVEQGDVQLSQDEIADEETILGCCSSLVRKSINADQLEPAHFTVKEFLLTIDPIATPHLAAYCLNPESDDVYFAKTCLTYIGLTEFSIPCVSEKEIRERQAAFMFRNHAVVCWPDYARRRCQDAGVLELEKLLFRLPLSVQLSSWALEYIYSSPLREIDNRFKMSAEISRTASPLHYAALLGLTELCSWLLSQGCDGNATCSIGNALHCTLLGQNLGIISDMWECWSNTLTNLLDAGTSVHEAYDYCEWTPVLVNGYTPLQMALLNAIQDRGDGIAIELLKAGAQLNTACVDLFINMGSCSIISRIGQEMKAINTRELDDAKFFEFEACFPTARKKNLSLSKLSSLLTGEMRKKVLEDIDQAITNDYLNLMKFYIESYEININDAVDKSLGETPLMIAARRTSHNCLRWLLDTGADVSVTDSQGRNAWHHACLRRGTRQSTETLRILKNYDIIDLSSAQTLDLSGQTPLIYATSCRSKNYVVFMMEISKDKAPKDKRGWSLLHYAAQSGSEEVVRYLLEAGYDPWEKSKCGCNVIHRAALSRSVNVNVIRCLAEHCQDLVSSQVDGDTTLGLFLRRPIPRYSREE